MAACNECGEKKNPAEAKFCAKCGSAIGTDSKNKRAKSGTPLSSRIEILADLWLNYKQDEDFTDFFEYNDIGLPLAYILENEIAEPTESAHKFINETFELLLTGLEIEEDEGFESLDDLLSLA